jgi:oligogalacturonide lyase
VDLKTHALRPLVEGKVRLLFVGRKTGQVYYQRMAEDGSGVVEAVDPKTKKVRQVAKLAKGVGIQTINADETLLAGVANRTDVPIPPNMMDALPRNPDDVKRPTAASCPTPRAARCS